MKKINSILLIILLICGGIFGYNYWKNSPEYSLLQIQKAVETNDKDLFEKYIDVDSIIEEIVDDVSKILLEKMNLEEDENSFFDPKVVAQGMIEIIKPTIDSSIEEGFESFWEENPDSEYYSNEDYERVKKALSSTKMSYLNKNGRVAFLGMEMLDPETNENTLFEFKLNKVENYWKISEISNLEKLIEDVIDDVENFLKEKK